jgi:hypothetical protein
MQAQITAEREKRAVIATSEGARQQAINVAIGAREAAIAKSEGEKQAEINVAQGEAQATLVNAEANAKAIRALMAPLVVQLVPLPTATLERISPAAVGFLAHFDVAMANGMTSRHAISIDPQRTVRALVYLGLWILWTMTCVSALSRGMSVREFARNVAIVATVVAVVGLAQKAMFNGKVLWFWTPDTYATNSFGPFVNRNHFAGWMMLAVPMTAGLALGYASRSDLAGRRTWRERMLWLGSPAASPMLVTSAAAVVMACALVWTMSRSGIIAMACAATACSPATATCA